jgi:hypothetical protein
MEELSEMVDMYKEGKITKFSMESELSKFLDLVTYSSVMLEANASGNDNATYIGGIMPESINGDIKVTFVLDDHLLKTMMTGDDVAAVLSGFKTVYQKAVMLLNQFLLDKKDSEVPVSECIKLYVDLYKLGAMSFPDSIVKKFGSANSYNAKAADDVDLALATGNETISRVVEYITVMHVMPKEFLNAAERLFKAVNVPQAAPSVAQNSIAAMDIPEENVLYGKMASNSDGTINPFEKHELDPFYVANTQ